MLIVYQCRLLSLGGTTKKNNQKKIFDTIIIFNFQSIIQIKHLNYPELDLYDLTNDKNYLYKFLQSFQYFLPVLVFFGDILCPGTAACTTKPTCCCG